MGIREGRKISLMISTEATMKDKGDQRKIQIQGSYRSLDGHILWFALSHAYSVRLYIFDGIVELFDDSLLSLCPFLILRILSAE